MEEVRAYKVDPASGHLVTASPMQPGQIILCVPPLVIGPGRGQTPVCLGCGLTPTAVESPTGELTGCADCNWPVCGVAECRRQFHPADECGLLKSEKCCEANKFGEKSNMFDFILPLRVARLMKSNAEFAKALEVEPIDTKSIMEACRTREENSDKSIREKLTKFKLSSDDIEKAVSIIERHKIPLEGGARGLYLETMRLTHSCSPNTYYMGLSNGWVVVKANRYLNAGEVITICVVPNDKCNYFREKLLREVGIRCSCPRCTDSTELGTGFGCLLCTECSGMLSQQKPGDDSSKWTCSGCPITKSHSECTAILDNLDKQVSELAAKPPEEKDPAWMEQVLVERPDNWKLLPPTSQLILDMKRLLAYTYQYHPQYYFAKLDWLKKKEAHCNFWLDLMEKLAPGWSYQKVLMRYELSNAKTGLIVAMKEAGIPNTEVNAVCYEVVDVVEEPIRMMIEEEDMSMCGVLKQQKMIATEAREEQKTRVYINRWADEDEEEW